MKPVSQRHKLIGGVFVIVGVAWSVDMLTGGPVPQDAAAADNPELLPGKVELPPDPEDLDQIIQALRKNRPPGKRYRLNWRRAICSLPRTGSWNKSNLTQCRCCRILITSRFLGKNRWHSIRNTIYRGYYRVVFHWR